MNNTLDSYTERSLEYSSNDSLGAKLQALPVPINYIAKTLFAQLLPFPIWFPFISGDTHLEYTYLRIVECFNPIFWIPIMAFVLFVFCRYSKVINKDLKIIFYLSLIYLFVCSMSEFNTRRLFAVYPIIFSIFLIVKTQFNIKMYKFNMLSYTALIFLHLIYLIIK